MTMEDAEKQLVECYGYAKRLAVALHEKHYSDITQWKPLDDLIGLLTQIDNMTAALSPAPVSAEPLTLAISRDRLREKIASDPDLEVEVRSAKYQPDLAAEIARFRKAAEKARYVLADEDATGEEWKDALIALNDALADQKGGA